MCSIFTSRYCHPTKKGAYYYLSKYKTLAEILGTMGYDTIAVSSNAWVGPQTGLDKGIERFVYFNRQNFARKLSKKVLARAVFKPKEDKGTYLLFAQSQDIVSGLPSDRPVFLYVHASVHHPYRAPDHLIRKFDSQVDPDVARSLTGSQEKLVNLISSGAIDPEHSRALLAIYDANLRYVDEKIAALVDVFRTRLGDDSIVVVTADHGEYIGEHGLISHGALPYETILRVPLIISHRGHEKVIPEAVSSLDIVPTLLDLAGGEDNALEGTSLLSGEQGRRPIFTRHIAAEGGEDTPISIRDFPTAEMDHFIGEQVAVKLGKEKLIWFSSGHRLLFDIEADPGEMNDISASSPERVEQLSRLAEEFLAGRNEEDLESTADVEFEDGVKDHLRALGYID
jgi:arylsulfatase A-like enzyme